MTADLRLVADAADADAFELPAERPCDRTTKRRLSDSRRADEAENRPSGLSGAGGNTIPAACGHQRPHRKELEDPVLDLLDVVVVLVEHFPGMRQIEVVLRRFVPRQRRDPLEIATHHPVLSHRRLQALEPGQLPVDLLSDLLGQLDRSELLTQLIDLGLNLVGFTQLLLDRLQLLAKEVLALALLELGLHLGLDLRAELHDLELLREDLGKPAQTLAHVKLLEQLLLFLGLQPQRPRDQMREDDRIVDVGDHHLQLLGQVRDLLNDPRERLLHISHQRRQLGARSHDVGGVRHLGDEIRLGGEEALDPNSLAALDQNPQSAVGNADHPGDHSDDADRIEVLRRRRLDLGVAAGNHHDRPVATQHVVDQLDAPWLADVQRDHHVRERHRIAQRQHSQAIRQRADAPDRDLLSLRVRDRDVDHFLSAVSIGTARETGSCGASGSSTRSIPSS